MAVASLPISGEDMGPVLQAGSNPHGGVVLHVT